jgi:GGDEF domain-containing protein
VRVAVVVLGAWLIACELHGLGLHWVPTGPEKWLHLVMMAIGAALAMARGIIRRRERAVWLLLGFGVLAWTLGELYFTKVLWSDASPPVPSPADAGAAIVFKPVLDSLHGLSISVITNFAYPVLDLVMLGLLCGLMAIGGRRLDRRLGVLALDVLCFWAADTVYLIKDAHGTWVSGGPYDPGWWTIAECVAIAAWMDAGPGRARASGRATLRIPVAFALIALAVLVAGTFTAITLPAVILASVALVSVMVRLVLTFRAHQAMLDVSRNEALTDPLTGLGNRRALAAALEDRLDDERADPIILALFDLDGFKSYNDSFGHSAGDALLQRLATALGALLDGRGGAYRMGGDESCALLPGDDAGRTLLRAAGLGAVRARRRL